MGESMRPTGSAPLLSPVSWKDVNISGGIWQMRQRINAAVTIPAQYEQIRKRGTLDVLQLKWKPGDDIHPFWDSDIGKWVEAAAYSLAKFPDAGLERQVDEIIDYIEAAQQEDGYFNTYYQLVEPDNKWTNLYYMHELYCAGHLTEGAVAYYHATGKRKMLDIMCRYMDLIDSKFGRAPGKTRGYCGHQEIELALVKLYKATGERKYLELSRYFIDERGSAEPYYFEQESLQRGVDVEKKANQTRHLKHYLCCHGPFAEYQAHKPVKEQDAPVGHAVRAMYMYCAMADLAAEYGDAELLEACETIWTRLTGKQFYITGGIGPSPDGERFTFDYDLPNEMTYNETCASVGLVFWAHRMLQFAGDSRYADIMEQTLYNTILSSVSFEGDKFFYANYLTVYPDRFKYASKAIIDKMYPTRLPWFNVACCPPNVARLLAALGQYIYSTSDDAIYVHLYNDSEIEAALADTRVGVSQRTRYPWDGAVRIDVAPERSAVFAVALRRPGWCSRASVTVNGAPVRADIERGYMVIRREWQPGDVIELTLDMPVVKMEAHPAVRSNSGRVALQRGPVVYCLEQADNGIDLNDVALDAGADIAEQYEDDMLGGVVVLRTQGSRRSRTDWDGVLYRPAQSDKVGVELTAVPYYTWENRGQGEMVVWVKHE